MEIADTICRDFARQTQGLLAATLVGALVPASLSVYRGREIQDFALEQLDCIYAGLPSSNSTVQFVTSNVDVLLAQEFARAFMKLAEEQRELDSAARRSLYGNLKRLYLR